MLTYCHPTLSEEILRKFCIFWTNAFENISCCLLANLSSLNMLTSGFQWSAIISRLLNDLFLLAVNSLNYMIQYRNIIHATHNKFAVHAWRTYWNAEWYLWTILSSFSISSRVNICLYNLWECRVNYVNYFRIFFLFLSESVAWAVTASVCVYGT